MFGVSGAVKIMSAARAVPMLFAEAALIWVKGK